MLTGFSQFSPTDGVPAADSTEVLVWYSPTAILFGIRAFEAHGAVHATLADRDRIASDDHVQILLSTFNDGRQASVFAVNPFGVQSDGALVETGSTSGNGFNNAVVKRETADLSPDFVFESKGPANRVRVRGGGPDSVQEPPLPAQARSRTGASTSSARYSTPDTRTPGLPPSGPAPRSWRSSAGWSDSSDLRRGVVLDVTPSVTARTHGNPGYRGLGLRRRRAPSLGARSAGVSPTISR